MSQFIGDHDIRAILELGFRHGVSTCYMAAILEELGSGTHHDDRLGVRSGRQPKYPRIAEELSIVELRGYLL